MGCPCETRTSTCRSFATISSGLYRILAITVLLDVKDIPQVGPLQWGRSRMGCCLLRHCDQHLLATYMEATNLYNRNILQVHRFALRFLRPFRADLSIKKSSIFF